MKRVVLTGITGKVAQALVRQLTGVYDISGVSIVRMDQVLAQGGFSTWAEQLGAYRALVMEQLTTAFTGQDAVAHLGWNTRDENCGRGLDPLNVFVTDCVYAAALATRVPRLYLASSVHAYDFYRDRAPDAEPSGPWPEVDQDPFGWPPTSLYGVSKRWMEIAGQFYARRLAPDQKILVVRLGDVSRDGRPHHAELRLWDRHADLAGLFRAFVECPAEAPAYFCAYGVSDNHGEGSPRPLLDPVNPYGFVPGGNAFAETDRR
jgi:nucleoside-diphosphate-sugar epimerase